MIDYQQILSQLWFIFPLIIIVSLFSIIEKRISKKRKKERYKKFLQDNKQKGIEYEIKCGKYYENLGYIVEYNGLINDIKDGGIDLICKKDDKVKILVQCKSYNEVKSINHENIKVFHSNAIKHMDLNNLNKEYIELKYTVPNVNVFDKSAIKVFKDKYYNCRYEII